MAGNSGSLSASGPREGVAGGRDTENGGMKKKDLEKKKKRNSYFF